MKRISKIVLIIAGVFAGIGVACMVIAISMGLTTAGFKQMLRDGTFSFGSGYNLDISSWEIENKETVEIIENEENPEGGSEKMQTITISEECSNLNVEFGAGTLHISYADVSEIQITGKNIPDLKADAEDGTLEIEAVVSKSLSNLNGIDDRELEILIPKGMYFEDIDLDVGAAQADIDGLLAENIDIVIGAGQADISDLKAETLTITVGAGQADLVNVDTADMDVEVGMGQLTALVTGAVSDYDYDVECGMGDVVIADKTYGGLAAEHHEQNHHAERHIDVECGMGEVRVRFAE